MTTLLQLATNIAEARKRQGKTTTKLAANAGVSRVALQRFAIGNDIRVSTLLALADDLKMDIVLVPRAISHALSPHFQHASSNPAVGGADQEVAAHVHIPSAVEVAVQRMQKNLRLSKRSK